MPTVEHFPLPKREGGRESVDNVILAHRLCNRIDYSIFIGRSHEKDLERIRKAREAAAGATPSGSTMPTPPTVGTVGTVGTPGVHSGSDGFGKP